MTRNKLSVIFLSLILIGASVAPLRAEHFIPVWNGNPFNPMTICVTEVQFSGINLVPGDEIGIFDGTFCVGRGILTQTISPSNSSTFLYISCSKDDPETPAIDGYTEGQTIIYKIWDQSANVETSYVTHTFPYAPSYVFETFTQNETAVVGLFAFMTYTVSGTIKYPNAAQTPLAGIGVNLKNASGVIIATATTNASGIYAFNGIANGNYTLDASTTKTWGGVTASDVLLYKKHIGNIALLQGIFLASGDVNGSGGLSAIDVLLIKKRIGSLINSFVVGDWLFNNTPVTVNGGNVVLNFNGLCYGDANASKPNP